MKTILLMIILCLFSVPAQAQKMNRTYSMPNLDRGAKAPLSTLVLPSVNIPDGFMGELFGNTFDHVRQNLESKWIYLELLNERHLHFYEMPLAGATTTGGWFFCNGKMELYCGYAEFNKLEKAKETELYRKIKSQIVYKYVKSPCLSTEVNGTGGAFCYDVWLYKKDNKVVEISLWRDNIGIGIKYTAHWLLPQEPAKPKENGAGL